MRLQVVRKQPDIGIRVMEELVSRLRALEGSRRVAPLSCRSLVPNAWLCALVLTVDPPRAIRLVLAHVHERAVLQRKAEASQAATVPLVVPGPHDIDRLFHTAPRDGAGPFLGLRPLDE